MSKKHHHHHKKRHHHHKKHHHHHKKRHHDDKKHHHHDKKEHHHHKKNNMMVVLSLLIYYLFFICGRFNHTGNEQWYDVIEGEYKLLEKIIDPFFILNEENDDFFKIDRFGDDPAVKTWFKSRTIFAPFINSYANVKDRGWKKILKVILIIPLIFLSVIGHVIQFGYSVYNLFYDDDSLKYILPYIEQLLNILIIMFIMFISTKRYRGSAFNVLNTLSMLIIIYYVLKS